MSKSDAQADHEGKTLIFLPPLTLLPALLLFYHCYSSYQHQCLLSAIDSSCHDEKRNGLTPPLGPEPCLPPSHYLLLKTLQDSMTTVLGTFIPSLYCYYFYYYSYKLYNIFSPGIT